MTIQKSGHLKNLSTSAMILAAGLSTRMRPLTDTIPKPLVKLGGKALIEHVIVRLQEAGVEQVIVNMHYLPDALEQHFKGRIDPHIILSDERTQILDSGGGAKKMLPHMGGKPFLLANSDTAWIDGATSNVQRLVEQWDPEKMDILLLLAATSTSLGFDGKGDFLADGDGRLLRRNEQEVAPFAYAGFAILKPELFDDTPDGPFSLNLLFDRAIEKGRLYGTRLDGIWMHVGTPQSLHEAEGLLKSSTH